MHHLPCAPTLNFRGGGLHVQRVKNLGDVEVVQDSFHQPTNDHLIHLFVRTFLDRKLYIFRFLNYANYYNNTTNNNHNHNHNHNHNNDNNRAVGLRVQAFISHNPVAQWMPKCPDG